MLKFMLLARQMTLKERIVDFNTKNKYMNIFYKYNIYFYAICKLLSRSLRS